MIHRRTLLALSLFIGIIYGNDPIGAQPMSLSGWFHVNWGDPPPGSTMEPLMRYILIDDKGQAFQLQLDDALIRQVGGPLTLNRKRISVKGEWKGFWHPQRNSSSQQTSVVSVDSMEPQMPEDAKAAALGGAFFEVAGSKPYISILCKFADIAKEPESSSYFQEMTAGEFPGLDHYWRELSYDAVNLTGSASVGWYTLPQPRSYYVYDTDGDGEEDIDRQRAVKDCITAADADVYFPQFAGINLMFNADLDCCAWGGSRTLTLDGQTKQYGVTWNPPWAYRDIAVIAHEMGHSFGLPHSSGAYGKTYDNQWDLMSDTWTNCSLSHDDVYGCLGQHTIAYHKDQLGWILPDRKILVMPGDSATVILEQLSLPQSSNYTIVQIPIRGSDTNFYTVEVRRKVGYDGKLPRQGVIIHEVDTTRPRPANVLDTDNNGNTGDVGAMWTTGEVFTDTANNITVGVNAATETGFEVTVANDAPPLLDLVVSTLSAPKSVKQGKTITLKDTHQNVGTGSLASSKTDFYLSTDATLDSSDTLLCSRSVSSLAAGQTNKGSTKCTIPSGTVAGVYYIIVKADSDDGISETDESNNVINRAITIK